MLFIFAAHASSENNEMLLSAKLYKGKPLFVPASRKKLFEEIIKGKIVSYDGNKESLSRIQEVFKYASTTSEKSKLAANAFSSEDRTDQKTGWNLGSKYIVSWGKEEQTNEYERFILSSNDDKNKSKPEVEGDVQAGYSEDKGLELETNVKIKTDKITFTINGNYGQGGGSIGIGFHFAKESDSDDTAEDDVKVIYVTEVETENWVMLLPTYTEGKFDNLARQIKERRAQITKTFLY